MTDSTPTRIWLRQNDPDMIGLLTASVRANQVVQRVEILRTGSSALLAASGAVAVLVPALRTQLVVSGALWSLLLLVGLRSWAVRGSVRAAMIQESFDTELFGLPWNRVRADARPQSYDVVALARRASRACRVLLVVVGPDWERAPAPNGGRRLDDPLDWVRREIVAATEGGAWIVPVLVGTRPRLRAADLPEDVECLTHLQFLHLPNGFGGREVAGVVDALLDRVDVAEHHDDP